MGIKEDFLNYTKWGATKFTDYFTMPFKNASKTDGLWKHLQELRQKTYDAIAGLENGKVDKIQLTTTNETSKIPIFNKNGEISKKLFNRKVIDIPSFNYNIPNENFDIVIPCSAYRGSLKVKLTGEWSYLNCTGEFEKTFRLYASTTVINEQQSSYTSLESDMSNHFAILNATLQNGELHIRIAKLTSTVNIASGKVILEGEGGNVQDIDNAYASGLYIASVSGISRPVLQNKGNKILVDNDSSIKKSSSTIMEIKNDADIIHFNIDTISNATTINREQMITSYSADGGGLIPSYSNKPQYGELFVYDGAEYSKFARYSFYKKDNLTSPEFQLIQNNGITITNKNNGGTVVVTGAIAPKFTAKIFTVYN